MAILIGVTVARQQFRNSREHQRRLLIPQSVPDAPLDLQQKLSSARLLVINPDALAGENRRFLSFFRPAVRTGVDLKLRFTDIVLKSFIQTSRDSRESYLRESFTRALEKPQMIAAKRKQVENASRGEVRNERTHFEM